MTVRTRPRRSAGARPQLDRLATTVGGDYRPDIDGLRALAILLVVGYHVWLGRVSGGVDVFLMLSAFFLTRTFLTRMQSGVRVSPLERAVGVFRRLIPAAAVTLLAVLGVAHALYPASRWPSIWEQTWASLLYVQNWVLSADAVNYYVRSDIPSPLQHFWSLSVQGQAFVIWILILAVCQVAARRWSLSPARVVGTAFGVVFAVSLAYSIIRTATVQEAAYFDTFARLWEFAAGSLLVVALPHLRLPARARAVLGWLGLAGLVSVGMLLDVQGGFPGFLALWPILSAAAIVAAGTGDAPTLPTRILGSRAMRSVGTDAYALYLVHWPVLVTWMVLQRDQNVGIIAGVGVVALSLVLARLLTRFVDAPLRSWRRGTRSLVPGLGIIVVCLVAVASVTAVWQTSVTLRERSLASVEVRDNPGAAVLRNPFLDSGERDAPLLPSPTGLGEEWVQLERVCDASVGADDDIIYGTCFSTPSTPDADRTIVVAGDSHAQQLTATVLDIAEENGWGVMTLVKGGCALGLDENRSGPDGCEEWRDAAIDLIENLRPAAVMTIVTRAGVDGEPEVVRPGIDRTLDRFVSAGIPVLAVRDNPRFDFDMFECVTGPDPDGCVVDRALSLADENPAATLDREGVHLIDLTPWICPQDQCSGVIGNVAVYRDDNHLSRLYATTLGPSLAELLPLNIG